MLNLFRLNERGIVRLASLIWLLFVLSLVFGLSSSVSAQAPVIQTTPTKVRSSAPPMWAINLNLVAVPDTAFYFIKNTPAEKELWAFVKPGSWISPTDAPTDPVRQFWSGPTTYILSAKTGSPQPTDVYNPQFYDWFHDGVGTLFVAPDATPSDKEKVELPFSTPLKNLNHNFGEFTPETRFSSAQGFPKTTVVRGWVKGDDPAKGLLKTKATIHWYAPFVVVHEVTLRIEIQLAPGEELDDEMRAALANGDEELLDNLRRIKGAEVFRKSGPKMVADATKAAVEEVVQIAVEEVVSRGAGKLVRALRVRELARTAINGTRTELRALASSRRAARAAVGKPSGRWGWSFKAKKTLSLGKLNPGRPTATHTEFELDSPEIPSLEQPNTTPRDPDEPVDTDPVDTQPDGTEDEEEDKEPIIVNLDTGAAIAFCEEGSTVAPVLEAYVSDKEMVITQTALGEFTSAIGQFAGPNEKSRAAALLLRVRFILDLPSARAMALNVTRGVGANDKIIFGTGDTLGIKTITGDARFVRASVEQGVSFDVYLHTQSRLRGQ